MNVNFLVPIIEYGLLFSLLAFLMERSLILTGFVRGNTIGLIVVSFILVVIKQILYSSSAFYVAGLFIVFLCPLAVNRGDIINTIMKGRWWWKSESNKQDH